MVEYVEKQNKHKLRVIHVHVTSVYCKQITINVNAHGILPLKTIKKCFLVSEIIYENSVCETFSSTLYNRKNTKMSKLCLWILFSETFF